MVFIYPGEDNEMVFYKWSKRTVFFKERRNEKYMLEFIVKHITI